jgi:small-conductance mechanosensitive channel
MNAPQKAPENGSRSSRLILSLLLAILAGLLLAQQILPGKDASLEVNAPLATAPANNLVDQKPLQTARTLASLAATSDEQQYASQALRSADHEVDVAFQSALREAASQTSALTGPALQLSRQIDGLERQVKGDQQQIDQLTKALPAAKDPDQAAEDLQLAQAQLEVDRDELDDRNQDLIAAGGDRHAKIQQALDEHEQVQKQAEATQGKSLTAQLESPDALKTLPGKFRAWSSLADRKRQLSEASHDATDLAAQLTREHDALEKQTESASAASSTPGPPSHAGALAKLKTLALQRQTLTGLDRRVQDARALATTYDSWGLLIVSQQRTLLKTILRTFTMILLLIAAVYVAVVFIQRFFDRSEDDKRRRRNIRLVLSLGAQAIGVVLILLVIFGPPREMPTIIGLATAGLTVVLKDFIVAFFGWFALMSKHGIRVGDWVEINGVSGEVVEIGVFRTVLLETGNWTDAGHPTGRRVSFMNGFAIEGQYFNFSTTGQWLWDELRVVVPAGDHAYQKIDEIRKAVVEQTKGDAELAEREWKSATRNMVTGNFSAQPGVEMRPDAGGIQVIVRYITRAHERLEMRTRLYEELIHIMHYSGDAMEAVTS